MANVKNVQQIFVRTGWPEQIQMKQILQILQVRHINPAPHYLRSRTKNQINQKTNQKSINNRNVI